MDWDAFFFNLAAFTAGLFVLEFGADRFIDNTAIVASRLGVSQTLVALLTAGAEWEELAVVVASVAQSRSSLALGNVLGSSISNVLGAFSLGLLFHPGHVEFDSTAQIYTSILFALATVFAALAFYGWLDRAVGGAFVALFVVYLFSIGYAMYRGVLDAPDGPDDDDDEAEEGEHGNLSNNDEEQAVPEQAPTETSALIQTTQPPTPLKNHSLTYHTVQLILGFLALSLSGYVLSHSAASLADSLNLSGAVVGVTVLAFATTLPEKFVAVMSGARGHGGIVLANTAGSNIFLLTLCLGVTFLAGDQDELAASLAPFEILTTWAASAILFLIVFLGSSRWVGGLLLLLYLAFLVSEFTIFRR